MEPITYKLDFNGPAAKTHYPAVAKFTDEVLAKAEATIAPMARSYRHYLIKYKLEAPRSVEEYTFELLNLGILWRAYGSVALAVETAPFRLLAFLAEWRKKHQGTKTPNGIRCSGCESKCRVNQLRQLGLRQNFEVMVIPHSSDLSRWTPKPGEPVTGVVASACLSVLVQGGWELKRYDVPAHCVLLNECGCKKHWHLHTNAR
jgi:hypothetical protein